MHGMNAKCPFCNTIYRGITYRDYYLLCTCGAEGERLADLSWVWRKNGRSVTVTGFS